MIDNTLPLGIIKATDVEFLRIQSEASGSLTQRASGNSRLRFNLVNLSKKFPPESKPDYYLKPPSLPQHK